jgi:serine/threonine protein kinase
VAINEWIASVASATIGTYTKNNAKRMMTKLEFHRNNCGYSVDQWEIERKSLFISDVKLGNGAFANVYKGKIAGRAPLVAISRNMSIDLVDKHVAVKMLPKHTDETNRADLLDEMNFMKQLGYHSHIISLLGCVSDPDKPMIITEYCAHGDMLQFVRKHKYRTNLVPFSRFCSAPKTF